jgi:hypothetical protein
MKLVEHTSKNFDFEEKKLANSKKFLNQFLIYVLIWAFLTWSKLTSSKSLKLF